MLQSAPRRHLSAGEELCLSSEDTLSTTDGQIDALIIVLYGRLDVFWDGDENAFAEFTALGIDENTSSSKQTEPSEERLPAATAAAERLRLEKLTQLRKTPLATIRRGQTFGDQSLGLALDKLYPGAQLTSTSVPIRLTSGDAVTELIWISRALYEEHLREDRMTLSYHPLSSAAASSLSASSPRFSGEFRDWATHFFSRKDIVERAPSELGELSRRMLADTKMSKLLFQFPPLVLERVCHAMELHHFDADGLFLGIGDDIASISIVVHGALRILTLPPAAPTVSPVNKSPMLRTASAFHPRSTATTVASITAKPTTNDIVEQFLPGDVFGVSELLKRSPTTSSRVVYVQADTLILSVPRAVFERWLAPLHVDTIFNAGSLFQQLIDPSQATGNGRSHYNVEKKESKPTPGLTQQQSMVLKPPAANGPDGLSSVPLRTVNPHFQDEPSSDDSLAVVDVTLLLKKMGIFPLLPRFLLSEMLMETSVVHKAVGDVLFHEGEESQYLVVLLTGFLSFYSLEHMSTTLEMFQKHSFCHFSSFQGSQTNPEDFVVDELLEETGGTRTSVAIAKHRAAMHGVHIQTLHAHNAFRTGVLLDGTVCPATVVAQTNCECLVLEESVYVNLLKSHKPVVDLGKVDFPSLSVLSARSNGDQNDDNDELGETTPSGSLRSILSQRNPSTLSSAVAKFLERTQLPWLTRSSLKMQQLLYGMRCVSVHPGERLVRCNDVLDHLIIVLSGKLSLFVRQNEDVSTFLDASQRSVRSLMLERSVTSNYSTTSQQLYKEAHGSSISAEARGLSSPGAGARGRIGSRQDAFAKRKIIRSKISRISESGLFVNSVLAAVHEEKLQKRARGGTVIDIPEHQQLTSNAVKAAIIPTLPESPPFSSPLHHDRNRSTVSILIHSAASKTKLQQKIETRRATRTSLDGGLSGSLFLCHLGPGEVFGDEILAPHGNFRSNHDVFVDTSTSPTPASAAAGISPLANNSTSGGTQLILLDRQLFHSINSKTDAELEKELRVRSKLAKSKWHKAECKITCKLSQVSIHGTDTTGGGGTGKGTSKFFNLFKNILNQRCFLTMRTIADIPLLRDLSDASKRELCLAARFEALERGMNAYKENGAHSSDPRYYFLLSGRIGLYGKNLNGTFFSYSSTSNSSSAVPGTTTTTSTENCLREVLAGEGFGEFELLVPEFSRCISALALDSSCRLLSFPAATFLKHWPHTAQMKSDIEYLRTRVPFFSRLELEKIAYLYTTLSFQTFTRGSSIFEQGHATTTHFSNAGELYLIKEGTCAIRQRVALDTQQHADGKPSQPDASALKQSRQQKLPTHRPHQPEKHMLRVMVTVADVSDGHLFWIDGGVDSALPFTLQAVSASVTITNVAIDKLRAILPRTQLAALEKASNQMAALYRKQFDMAKRAVVTLMNEKRAALMGMTPNPTFLPVLDFQSPQRVIPSQPTVSNNNNSADTAIPFSRLLMTRPVDLVALQDHEREAKLLVQPEEPLESDSSQRHARYWHGASSSSVVDAVYQNQHLSEHYQLEHGLPNSTLVGSFPDDCSLRRRRSSGQRVEMTEESSAELPNSTLVSPQEPQRHAASSTSAKVDERMEPEPVGAHKAKAVGDATVHAKLNDSASHIHLEVKVPIFHDPSRVLSARVPTPPSGTRPKSRGGASLASAAAQAANLTPRSPRFSPGFQEIIGGSSGHGYDDDNNGFCDFEIDLRALLRAEMKDIDAPMRTIKLEPSLSKVNALGQYLTLSSPPASSLVAVSTQPRQAPPCLSNNSEFPKPKLKSSTPSKIFPQLKAHVKQTPVVPFASSAASIQGELNQGTLQCHEQASVRKQGFLCVVAVLDPQTPLVSVLPRVMQHRRRFFALVDNFLVEFPANVAIPELETTKSLSRYYLDEESGVSDIPIISGEAQATLQMSFVLTVDAKTRLILTAESATEKRKWMKELSQACALGPCSIPMHQQILQPQDAIPGLWNEYSNAPSTARGASRGPGSRLASPHNNAADAGAALGFEVEYRIG